jgi:hypothetical protein
MPEGIQKKCQLAVFFSSGPIVYGLCIGVSESDGEGKMDKYYIYDSMEGIS